MEHFEKGFHKLAKSFSRPPAHARVLLAYLKSGDPIALSTLLSLAERDLQDLHSLIVAAARPDRWEEPDRRLVRFVLQRSAVLQGKDKGEFMGEPSDWNVARVIERHLKDEKPDQDWCAPVREEAVALRIPEGRWATLVARHFEPRVINGKLTSAGRYLANLPVSEFLKILPNLHYHCTDRDVMPAIAREHPGLLFATMEELLRTKKVDHMPRGGWVAALDADALRFEKPVVAALELLKDREERLYLGQAVERHFPEKHRKVAVKAVKNIGEALGGSEQAAAARWLIEQQGADALPAIVSYIARWNLKNTFIQDWKVAVLKEATRLLGTAVIPALRAALQPDMPELRLGAIELWIGLETAANDEHLRDLLAAELASKDPKQATRGVILAGRWNPYLLSDQLWRLLEHSSKSVREASAVTVARLGEEHIVRASKLWSAKKADTRTAAVSWLKALGTPAALAALRDRLDDEENDDVRDAILLTLDQAGGGADADPAELKGRMKATLAQLDGPPAKWLAVKKLPAAKLKSGKPLDGDSLLYLLHRQSRVKDIRADLEARPLYAQVNRATSGDLALAVFHAWQGAGADAEHRWVLAFAALLGDDRLVPLLTRQIRDWAEAARGKLSEYAVQALALLGTDTALLAVDALAIRYRSKFKNIGKAATEAFAEAAAARELTPEELGDRVVPWLGFEPGKPRVIACGKTQVEVRLGGDFKFAYRDAASGKKLAKLPDSAPAEVKAEFKELAASLKEAVKAQHLRMEALMVRQFRWPVARFRELYVAHPLLVPFAQRLVWGHFAAGGKLTATFRTLDDLSLTDAADEPFTLPAKGEVGVVHPLELPADGRTAWVKHLADYAVEPPFAQLDRPVIAVKPDQTAQKFGKDLAGTELNAMTFKGRAERLGWARGSVCDAGGINYYRKTFPNAGVEVFLGLEGMFVGVDMDSEVTLGDWFFVRSGSVKIGSYEYDEPGNDTDPRLVPFGAVAPIAYSEALGDLARIAGKGTSADAEAGA
jgi:hypothetical protein